MNIRILFLKLKKKLEPMSYTNVYKIQNNTKPCKHV